MPNWFDVLQFFQTQMVGAELLFYELPRVVGSCIEMKVQTCTRWTMVRLFQSGRIWYVEYPMGDSCTVVKAVESKHYEFIEQSRLLKAT